MFHTRPKNDFLLINNYDVIKKNYIGLFSKKSANPGAMSDN